jgi:hypothetical protein
MNAPTFKTVLGSKQLLLSAPHVYAHRRPRLSMSYKLGEPLTDIVVDEVCNMSKAYGIVLTDESDFDANYHKEKDNPYKQEVREIITKNKIEYFIDIHGLKNGHMYDLAIYYPSKFSKSIRLANKLKEGLDRGELRGINIAILRFPSRLGETLGEYVASKLRVPSVQIEVARYIRENKSMRDSLVNNLTYVIEELVI